MTRAPKTCRRAHPMKGANVRKQTNKHKRADGTIAKYVTRICLACRDYRAGRNAKGKPVKDMRYGRR